MNNVLKQRLVGALILIALGVVFWPIIFVEKGGPVGAGETRMPPPPAVDTSPVEPPDLAGLRTAPPQEQDTAMEDAVDADVAGQAAEPNAAPVPPPATSPVPEAGHTRSEPPEKPSLDARGIPIVWSLQVASVSDAARADKLRGDLLAMGHKAYIRKVAVGGKTLYRVCVGPKAEKAQLDALRPEIDNRFGVSSRIVRYLP